MPADAESSTSRELGSILAEIDRVGEEAARMGQSAEERSRAVGRAAREQADEILETAREKAEAARAEAAANRTRERDQEMAALLSDAEREADRIRRVGAERLPLFVDRIVSRVLDDDDRAEEM